MSLARMPRGPLLWSNGGVFRLSRRFVRCNASCPKPSARPRQVSGRVVPRRGTRALHWRIRPWQPPTAPMAPMALAAGRPERGRGSSAPCSLLSPPFCSPCKHVMVLKVFPPFSLSHSHFRTHGAGASSPTTSVRVPSLWLVRCLHMLASEYSLLPRPLC